MAKILSILSKSAISIFLFTACALANVDNAQKFIEKISDDTLKIVSNKDLKDLDKQTKLNDMFLDAVDTEWIAKFVLGRYWTTATEEQKVKYLDLYKKFMANNYVPKFKEYSNQELVLKKYLDESDNEYLVLTEIKNPDAKTFSVDYKVRKGKDGKYRVFDIITEGISYISTQRSEFGSILSREGLDDLISKLEAKVKS